MTEPIRMNRISNLKAQKYLDEHQELKPVCYVKIGNSETRSSDIIPQVVPVIFDLHFKDEVLGIDEFLLPYPRYLQPEIIIPSGIVSSQEVRVPLIWEGDSLLDLIKKLTTLETSPDLLSVDAKIQRVGIMNEAASRRDEFLLLLNELPDQEKLKEGPPISILREWLGSHDLALQFMALGKYYGLWDLFTIKDIPYMGCDKITDEENREHINNGLMYVKWIR